MRTTRRATATVILILLAPSVAAHHWAPIQPGALHESGGAWCTFNLVFEDDDDWFIGSAGHCVGQVGSRISTPLTGEFGTVVYQNESLTAAVAPGEARKDFALIQIDRDQHGNVSAAIRGWGGPIAVEEDFLPGTPLLQYGNGIALSSTEPSRGRVGHLVWTQGHTAMVDRPEWHGWFVGNVPVINGDSGSIVLTAQGNALGVTSTLGAGYGEPGAIMGPSFHQILQDLAQQGIHVRVATAPFAVEDPASFATQKAHLVEHCAKQLGGDEWSDACVKVAWPDRRRGEPGELSAAGGRGEPVLWTTGTILAGGPHSGYFTAPHNPVMFGVPPSEASPEQFEFEAPEPGSLIATRTTDNGGLGYDVDIHFYRPNGGFFWGEGCATPAPDEVCEVPAGAGIVEIAAYHGVDLEVEVWVWPPLPEAVEEPQEAGATPLEPQGDNPSNSPQEMAAAGHEDNVQEATTEERRVPGPELILFIILVLGMARFRRRSM